MPFLGEKDQSVFFLNFGIKIPLAILLNKLDNSRFLDTNLTNTHCQTSIYFLYF